MGYLSNCTSVINIGANDNRTFGADNQTFLFSLPEAPVKDVELESSLGTSEEFKTAQNNDSFVKNLDSLIRAALSALPMTSKYSTKT